MKNILLVIDSLAGGGAEKVVLILSRAFSHMGHNVHIITIDDNIEYDIDFDINLHTLGFKKSHLQPTYIKYGKALRNLTAQLEKKYDRFDLTVSFLKKAHRIMAKAGNPNAYYSIRNTLSQSILKNHSGLRRVIKTQKLKALYDNKNILTVSKGCENDLIENVGIKPKFIRTIYNPIDFERINKLAKCANPYHELNYIAHVGRLSEAKRQDLLLNAFALANTDCRLILVGDGPLRKELESLANKLGISKQVIFAGFQQNPYPIIKDAKLCALSSDYEGLPNAILDALSVGTPVVSTDCPSGPAEILTGHLANYLIPVGNPHAFADKIKKALQEIENGALKIPEDLLEKFNALHIAQQYIDLCAR
jgi:glycosyltransferase involved in cell wall biosynthesis